MSLMREIYPERPFRIVDVHMTGAPHADKRRDNTNLRAIERMATGA